MGGTNLSDWASVKAAYTYTATKTAGAYLERIPQSLFQATVDLHPMDMPFGASATLNYVGKAVRTVAAGPVQYGKYAVVDVAGRYFIDTDRKHVLSLKLANVFNEHYGLPGNGFTDASGSTNAYTVQNRGMPRTLSLSYTFNFN